MVLKYIFPGTLLSFLCGGNVDNPAIFVFTVFEAHIFFQKIISNLDYH